MAKIRDGSTYLGEHLTKNDYYSKDEQVTGHWVGRLANEWGLDNGQRIAAGDETFEKLRTGQTPSGEKLTQRDGSDVKFYDFQVGAGKSVSIMAVMMGDTRLREAHEKASNLAFSELEKFAGMRDRKGEKAYSKDALVTGNLCAAKFTHDASRELDPQLHSHYVVANVTVGPDGKRYAVETLHMCKAIRYGGKVYQAEMARACRDLGYEIRDVTNRKGQVEGFEIAGVNDELVKRYSKRRAEVEAAIEKFRQDKGREPSAGEIHVLTAESRKSRYNMHEITTPEVRAKQLSQLSPDEREKLEGLVNQAKGPLPSRESAAVEASDSAREHIFERSSVSEKHELLAESLNRGLGHIRVSDLAEVRDSSLIATGSGSGLREQFTTQDNLRREKWSVDHVDSTRNKRSPLVKGNLAKDEKLSQEQQGAVEYAAKSRDQVSLIRGLAGTGKSTTLQSLNTTMREAGHKVLYLAPSSTAVEKLRGDGLTNATTVADYLQKTRAGGAPSAKLVVCDEAGLLSTKDGSSLLKQASANGSRVLLVGDSKQHSAVGAGDFQRLLEDHSKVSRYELGTIRRQKDPRYRDAVQSLAQGQAQAGVTKLNMLGWVHEGKDYLQRAADRYLDHVKEGKDGIGVAPTHVEVREFNDKIRDGLRQMGRITSEENVSSFDNFQLTNEDKRKLSTYRPGLEVAATGGKVAGLKPGETARVASVEKNHVVLSNGQKLDPREAGTKISVGESRQIALGTGDKVLITANEKKAGLVNGQRLTISGMDKEGNWITQEGKTIPSGFRHLSHGYVTTSHKSQGESVETSVVAAARLDSKSAYVALSRGKEKVDLFTPDKEHLMKGLKNDSKRATALDAMGEAKKQTFAQRAKLWTDNLKTRASEAWERFRSGNVHRPKEKPYRGENQEQTENRVRRTRQSQQAAKEQVFTREYIPTVQRHIEQEQTRSRDGLSR